MFQIPKAIKLSTDPVFFFEQVTNVKLKLCFASQSNQRCTNHLPKLFNGCNLSSLMQNTRQADFELQDFKKEFIQNKTHSNKRYLDAESNVSGFIRYSDEEIKKLYSSVIKNMQGINQDVLEIERNLKNIVQDSGYLEKQMTALLQALSQPSISLSMEDRR